MPQRWSNIQFEFVSLAGDADTNGGTVLVRDGEMVLEVECLGDRPYVIVGKAVDGFYRGFHQGQPDDAPVTAKWIRLDDIYIGTWREEGTEYLFRFRLPEEGDTP
ncbi:MAG: hypothetical protein ACLQPN_06965 [Bryobacteraceae bacterium]